MENKYYELRLQINPDMEDLLSEIFFDNFDCEGIVLAEETYKDLEMVATTEGTLRVFLRNDYDDIEDLRYDIENVLDLTREEFLSRGLTEDELGSWEFTLEEKENEDWSKKWKESWDVTHVTENIAVVPDWIEYTPKDSEVIIKLEPGCAFGTGTHQTTQLCMKALEKYMKHGDKVADIGMGSGILSILAKKLGASFVYGCDNDETVIDVAKENARKNGLKVAETLDFANNNTSIEASHKYNQNNIQLAKNLRNNATTPEKILWNYLQNSKLDGVKFRRQQPIRDYIVDFASTSSKLIIELDGGQHNEPKNISQDKNRDEYLVQQGFTVIRIWNNEVYNNIEGVVDYIRNIISNPTRKSQIFTLPQGEGSNTTYLLKSEKNTRIDISDKEKLIYTDSAKLDNTPIEKNTNVQNPPLEGGSKSSISGWGEKLSKDFDCYFELNTADKVQEKFDFVCANILHFVLAEIMNDLKNIMKSGAIMSLSGILEEKKQMVLDAIERENLEIVEEIKQDQWTSFVVKKP